MNCAMVGTCSALAAGATSARGWTDATVSAARIRNNARFITLLGDSHDARDRQKILHPVTEYAAMNRTFVLGLAVVAAAASIGAQSQPSLTAEMIKGMPLRALGPDITTGRISD